MLVGQGLRELRVVRAEVVDVDAALGDAGGAARLKDIDGFVGQTLGHPTAHRSAAQPLVFKKAELFEIVKTVDVLERVEVKTLRPIEPELAPGLGIEVPLHDFADVRVQTLSGGVHFGLELGVDDNRHVLWLT